MIFELAVKNYPDIFLGKMFTFSSFLLIYVFSFNIEDNESWILRICFSRNLAFVLIWFIDFFTLFWHDPFLYPLIIIFYRYLCIFFVFSSDAFIIALISSGSCDFAVALIFDNCKKIHHWLISSIWCVCSKYHYNPMIVLQYSRH